MTLERGFFGGRRRGIFLGFAGLFSW